MLTYAVPKTTPSTNKAKPPTKMHQGLEDGRIGQSTTGLSLYCLCSDVLLIEGPGGEAKAFFRPSMDIPKSLSGPGNEARLELCGSIEAAMAKDDIEPHKTGTNEDTEPILYVCSTCYGR